MATVMGEWGVAEALCMPSQGSEPGRDLITTAA